MVVTTKVVVERQRLNDELRKIRQLIDTNPQIKARFDKDGNGVIDGEEWEAVRQLVIRRIERKDAERAAAAEATSTSSGAAPSPPAIEDGAIATQIVERDLAPPSDEGRGLLGVDEFVLTQGGGIAQFAEGTTRRVYTVCSRSGRQLASLAQVENEMVQGLSNKNVFEVPPLHFALSAADQPLMVMERHFMNGGMRIDVKDEGGSILAHTQVTRSLLRLEMRVHGALDTHGLIVKKKIFSLATYDITDAFDEKVGVVERGWSGLAGLMTGGNLLRVELRPDKGTPGLRLGLVAAALALDLSVEPDDD